MGRVPFESFGVWLAFIDLKFRSDPHVGSVARTSSWRGFQPRHAQLRPSRSRAHPAGFISAQAFEGRLIMQGTLELASAHASRRQLVMQGSLRGR